MPRAPKGAAPTIFLEEIEESESRKKKKISKKEEG